MKSKFLKFLKFLKVLKTLKALRLFRLKNLKSKILLKTTFILSFILYTVIPTIISFADDIEAIKPEVNYQIKEATPEMTKLLIKFSDYLNFNGVIEDVIQYFKYIILRGLYHLADIGYKAYKSIFELNTYFDSQKVNFIYKTVLPITVGILFLSFVYIGYRMLLQKKDDRVGFVSNIILAGCLILIFPTSLITMNSLAKLSFDMINSFSTNGMTKQEIHKLNEKIRTEDGKEYATEVSPVDNIYKTLFIDMQRVNNEKFEKEIDLENPNGLTVSELNRINPTRIISNKNDILNYKLNGNKAEEVGWTLLGNPGYYSWTFLFWQGTAYLLLIAYVYILSGIKQAGAIFNLAALKILSPLFFASDIVTGERIKAVIKEVLNSYTMIIGMHFLITLYSFFMIWVANLKIPFYVKLIFLVGGAIATVGAGIYERVLGVSGAGSRFSPLQTMYQMKMLTGGIFRKLAHNSVSRGFKNGVGKVAKNTFSKNSPYFDKGNSNNTSKISSQGNNRESGSSRAGDNLKRIKQTGGNISSKNSQNLKNNTNSNNSNNSNNSSRNGGYNNSNSNNNRGGGFRNNESLGSSNSSYRQSFNKKTTNTTRSTRTTSNRETRSSMFTRNNSSQRKDNLRR